MNFWIGLGWFFLGTVGCLVLARRLKEVALEGLARLFGVEFGLPLFALLTLPGFFLHEAAHALSAFLLRVPIRGVHFIPRPSPDGRSLSASVEIGRCDALRMALVALAPFLAGVAALGLLCGVSGALAPEPRPWVRLPAWLAGLDWGSSSLWAALYLVGSISLHLAPSRADLAYVPGGMTALWGVLLLSGFLLPLFGEALPGQAGKLFTRLGDGLLVGAALNGVLLVPLLLLRRWWGSRYAPGT